MLRSRWRVIIAACTGLAALLAAAAATSARGMGTAGAMGLSPKRLLTGDLYGNLPDVVVRGIRSGAAPWVVRGSVELTVDALTAKGTWLVVGPGRLADGKPVPRSMVGTTARFRSVVAAVSCANARRPVVTSPTRLSAKGAFTIDAMVVVPAPCAEPVVLIGSSNGRGGMASWWASTDFLAQYGRATPALIRSFSKKA